MLHMYITHSLCIGGRGGACALRTSHVGSALPRRRRGALRTRKPADSRICASVQSRAASPCFLTSRSASNVRRVSLPAASLSRTSTLSISLNARIWSRRAALLMPISALH